jgi:hypothetical protein
VRAALRRVFDTITLVRHEGELLLVPRVRELAEVAAWLDVGEGQALVQARPERIAVPGKQTDTKVRVANGGGPRPRGARTGECERDQGNHRRLAHRLTSSKSMTSACDASLIRC